MQYLWQETSAENHENIIGSNRQLAKKNRGLTFFSKLTHNDHSDKLKSIAKCKSIHVYTRPCLYSRFL